MNRIKRLIALVFAVIMIIGVFPIQSVAASKTVVERRIKEIRQLYPQDSAFDEWVRVQPYLDYGGCNGLVAYVTEKIFHDAYYDGSESFKLVGKAPTSSRSKMRRAFKKAKIGDVIRWSQNGEGSHYAIFLSDSAKGVYVYEANFNGPNQVWYKHLWRWNVMKKWPVDGADEVRVYRAANYDAVNSKTSALKTPVGTVLTVNEEANLQVMVLDNSINNGAAVVLEGYTPGIEFPQGIGLKGDKLLTYDTKKACLAGDANTYEYFTVVTYEELQPTRVRKLTVTIPKKRILKATWKRVKGVDGYEIYRASEKKGPYKLVKTIKGESKITYTDKKLSKKKTFYYKVRAYKQVGNEKFYGDFSKVVSGKISKN